ncbi:MAG TPA: Na+/H+ antiporter NhaA [Acidimicrobiales bacterium]
MTRAVREFLATEVAGGVVLLVATTVALVWANSPWSDAYDRLWHTEAVIGVGRWRLDLDLRHWVNDGLMAIFFLVVGLEVKREFLQGELRERNKAVLPVAAALGGMVVPALLYTAFNLSGSGADGWGVPMATDIAFALGVLALVAPRLPGSLRIFLLALAIVDDIGAIVVIAVFYTSELQPAWLAAAAAIVVSVFGLRRLGMSARPLFVVLGVGLWLAVHASGVHATIAGVVMGLLVPATPRLDREIMISRADELLNVFTPDDARQTSKLARLSVSELEWIQHMLHPLSSLLIVPIFALANAGVALTAADLADATRSPVTLGVVVGLVVGKTVGITGAAWLATRAGIATLGAGVRWRQLTGVAALGGIGFTVSLFITDLAFDAERTIAEAKIGILAASLLASVVGAVLLRSRAT